MNFLALFVEKTKVQNVLCALEIANFKNNHLHLQSIRKALAERTMIPINYLKRKELRCCNGPVNIQTSPDWNPVVGSEFYMQ